MQKVVVQEVVVQEVVVQEVQLELNVGQIKLVDFEVFVVNYSM